nr:hypothetical protein BaRGS_031162 [Batillaria attramentaria]
MQTPPDMTHLPEGILSASSPEETGAYCFAFRDLHVFNDAWSGVVVHNFMVMIDAVLGAWRVVLDAGFLRVCPIQPHFLRRICLATGSCPARSHSYLEHPQDNNDPL